MLLLQSIQTPRNLDVLVEERLDHKCGVVMLTEKVIPLFLIVLGQLGGTLKHLQM
jgi:hypothetical protein